MPFRVHLFGYLGVDIFFIISGFIMSNVTNDKPLASNFILGRITRIMPSYWLMTTLWVFLFTVSGYGSYSSGLLFKSYLLIPQDQLPVLGPGWTLEHEAIFYAFVAVFLLINRMMLLPFFMLALGSVGVILHLLLPAAGYAETWDLHIFSPYNLYFGVGFLIHRHRDRLPVAIGPALIVLGFILIVVAGWLINTAYGWRHVETQPIGAEGLVHVVTGLLAASVLVVGLVSTEAARPSFFDKSELLKGIGDSSYALYLIHTIIFAGISVIAGRLLPHTFLIAWIVCILSVVAALMNAYVWYSLFESRMTKALKPADRIRPQQA